MSSQQLGPIDIQCDAPSYAIVRACQQLGFRAPEDVRWCRLSDLPRQKATGWLQFLLRLLFLGRSRSADNVCFCGHPVPRMEKCTFTLRNGSDKTYRIGQCPRCHTLFWDET